MCMHTSAYVYILLMQYPLLDGRVYALASMEISELSMELGHSRCSSSACGWEENLWNSRPGEWRGHFCYGNISTLG